MSMVASPQRIASAYFVLFGKYGEVTRYAELRGVCRQWVYREATALRQALARRHQTIERLRAQVGTLQRQVTDLQQHLRQAVIVDSQRQAQFASVGQACGAGLPRCQGS